MAVRWSKQTRGSRSRALFATKRIGFMEGRSFCHNFVLNLIRPTKRPCLTFQVAFDRNLNNVGMVQFIAPKSNSRGKTLLGSNSLIRRKLPGHDTSLSVHTYSTHGMHTSRLCLNVQSVDITFRRSGIPNKPTAATPSLDDSSRSCCCSFKIYMPFF